MYFLILLLFFCFPSIALCSVAIPDHFEVNMGTIGLLCASLLTALALMWGLRKLVKILNRS